MNYQLAYTDVRQGQKWKLNQLLSYLWTRPRTIENIDLVRNQFQSYSHFNSDDKMQLASGFYLLFENNDLFTETYGHSDNPLINYLDKNN